jgi:hypothetical protein
MEHQLLLTISGFIQTQPASMGSLTHQQLVLRLRHLLQVYHRLKGLYLEARSLQLLERISLWRKLTKLSLWQTLTAT